MFWLLLDPDANAGRHLAPEGMRNEGAWQRLCGSIRDHFYSALGLGRRR